MDYKADESNSVKVSSNLSTMSNKEPLVSIGMPVYNGENYIEYALNSILSQTFTDYEIIISDNASNDETEAICRRFQNVNSNIRYYRNPKNLGASYNYNEVFRRAKGKYFKWAAADDMIENTYLERCVQALNGNSDAVLSYTKTSIVDGCGDTLYLYDDSLDVASDNPAQRFISFYKEIRECNAIFGVIRSDVLRHTPLIGNFVGSDIHLLAELSLYGKFLCIPERLFFRRDHIDASSYDKSDQAQVEFFDPAKSQTGIASNWNAAIANLSAVRRSPVSFANKTALTIFCMRRMYWYKIQLWKELPTALRNLLSCRI